MRCPWKVAEYRHWFRLTVERVTRKSQDTTWYECYKENEKVKWFWSRKTAEAFAQTLNEVKDIMTHSNLPPLPEATIVSYQTDSTMRSMELRTYGDMSMVDYAQKSYDLGRQDGLTEARKGQLGKIPEVVSHLGGATWMGMKVAGWVWDSPSPLGDTTRYASHWSTGPKDAERLYRESDVRDLLVNCGSHTGSHDTELRSEVVEQVKYQLQNQAIVYTNMVRGIIAPITMEQCAHVHGEEMVSRWQAFEAWERKQAADALQKEAIKQVIDNLSKLSKEEFKKKLKEYDNDPLTLALQAASNEIDRDIK